MRFALLSLLLVPGFADADTFVVPSKATSATIYAQGGFVTHRLTLTLPAGSHQIILPDLPPNIPTERLRVTANDVRLNSLSYRTDFVPPSSTDDNPEVIAAKARVEEVEDQIQSVKDDAARATLAAGAADDQITFLTGLSGSESLPSDTEDLRALTRMIGEETLTARQAQFDAKLEERRIREELKDLQDDLADANAALRALVPEAKDRPLLVLDLSASDAVTASPVEIAYFVYDVSWRPTYDIRLADGDAPKITLDRAAWVRQSTGENWKNIALTLSSQPLEQGVEPGKLRPDLRRLVDPEDMPRVQKMVRTLSANSDAEVFAESPVIVAEAAGATIATAGLEVEYRFANPVNIATGADELRLPFDSVAFDARLVARAVPMQNDRAFLVAEFTNDSTEPLLASWDGLRYFDGALVGGADFPELPAGASSELGFGPISGLKIDRTILDRNEGDRGLISRSNEQTERVRIDLENLTNRTWSVELIDRVPYSEQEDLAITYTASPRPDETSVEDQRGILQWNIEMPTGNTATVTTEFKMTWPEGQIVQ